MRAEHEGRDARGEGMRGGRAAAASALVVLASVALMPSCGDAPLDLGVAFALGGDGGPGAGEGGGPGGVLPDGAVPGDGRAPGFCEGAGPPVQLPGGTCTGDVGQRTFRFALCACTTAAISGVLTTRSFNSLGAPTSQNAASVGANGQLATNTRLTLGGSAWSAGQGGVDVAVSLASGGSVANEIRAGGRVRIDGDFQVGGDVYAASGVEVVRGGLSVAGKLHTPASAPRAGVTASGGVVTEAVVVPEPCPCARRLDIGAIVAAASSDNDDAALGLDPAALAKVSSRELDLPCGRYAFTEITGERVTIRASGRTAIFVAGDMKVTAALTLELAPQAEVDLFVAGDLGLAGTTALGSKTAPSRVRVYAGGAALTITGDAQIGANVYAPNADVEISSAFQMAGAFFAKSLRCAGDLALDYDEAILDVQGCDPPGRACQSCQDCSGATPACKGGKCVACATTADCCAPLVCRDGRCVADIR